MRGLTRLIAIDPAPKGFAWAVLEGSECLVDCGLAVLGQRDLSRFLERLDHLILRYRPDALALEEPAGSRKRSRARECLAWAEHACHEQGIRAVPVERQRVQRAFAQSGTTKIEIAVAVARLFPELERRMPRKRKLYQSEDERMNLFNAISFGLVALGEIEQTS